MEAGNSETDKDPGKAHFQQELNRWFESRGILSDLRSHLRQLMINALQNTQIGLKPSDKTSPKAQALNLIVAEYLFRHGCHYTLSVFTSEVPTLANFSAVNPSTIMTGEKISETVKKQSQRHCFQEKELEEILNALGMTSTFEELDRLKGRYFQKGYESSLLEVFLQIFIEASTKLEVKKILESDEVDGGRKILSEKWTARVVDILLGGNIKSNQIAPIEKAISRITEREVKRLLEQEYKIQLQILAERETRIQENLRKHEQEVFVRLMEAEKELNERKNIIDEELTDRQKHLTKMALEWNEKHEEILKLSKNFHNIQNENMRLGNRAEELEKENSNYRSENDALKKTVEQLESEIKSLVNKVREVTGSNVSLNERIEVLMRRENKEVFVSHEDDEEENVKESAKKTDDNTKRTESIERKKSSDSPKVWITPQPDRKTTEACKGSLDSGDGFHVPIIDLSEDENDSSSNSVCSDEIITNVRQKLQALEEETNRVNKNYTSYKLKWQIWESDSETSSGRAEKAEEKVQPLEVHVNVIKENRFCQTSSPDSDVLNILKIQKQEMETIDCVQNLSEGSEISLKKPEMRTPTKRQQQNREFFLTSRRLLQELEKVKMQELIAISPSLVESSYQNFTSSPSEEFGIYESPKKSPKEPALLTPLRTTSFYCNEQPEIKKQTSVEVSKRVEGLSIDDKNCLALLEETRIKSPQESVRKLLRQQILMSEPEDEKQKSTEDKNQKTPKSAMSTPNSAFSGKVSFGRRSGSDGFW